MISAYHRIANQYHTLAAFKETFLELAKNRILQLEMRGNPKAKLAREDVKDFLRRKNLGFFSWCGTTRAEKIYKKIERHDFFHAQAELKIADSRLMQNFAKKLRAC